MKTINLKELHKDPSQMPDKFRGINFTYTNYNQYDEYGICKIITGVLAGFIGIVLIIIGLSVKDNLHVIAYVGITLLVFALLLMILFDRCCTHYVNINIIDSLLQEMKPVKLTKEFALSLRGYNEKHLLYYMDTIEV